jgi:hypothetical protein
MPTGQYGQIYGQGVKYLKVNRYDSGGLDRSSYLGQLTNLTINYNDLGPIQYNIVTTQEQDTYFVYGIQTRNQSTSSVNYEVLDYNFLATSASSWTCGFSPTSIPNEYFTNRVASYGNINGNTLGYLTGSSGIYTAGNTPNIFLKVQISGSGTISAGSTNLYAYVAKNGGSGADGVQSILINNSYTGGNFNTTLYLTSSFSIIENDQIGFGLYRTVELSLLTISNFHVSLSLHSASINPATSSLIIFNPEFIDWDYNDYNALLGNAETSQFSNTFMDVDYTSTFTTPVNFDLIISGTANRASVQDSNYNSQAWSNIRYNGVESNSPDFNQLTTNGGYGALPNVEQNKTYIAYFDGVGGTGPEVINQTAYFIRYIIDEQGNVVNPEPDTTALYNLLDSYESGKNALVRLISGDPTQNANPNDDTLTGLHPITYVGRIAPLLISETGSGLQDYNSVLYFRDLDAFSTINTTNYAFNGSTQTDTNIATADAATTIVPTNINLPNSNYNSGTGRYTFADNPSFFSNRVNFRAVGTILGRFSPSAPAGSTFDAPIRIMKNGSELVSDILTFTKADQYVLEDLQYVNLQTGLQTFTSGDYVTVEIDFINQPYIATTGHKVLAGFQFIATPEYPANSATASGNHWTVGEYLTGNNVSVLTSSLDIYNWAYNNMIQSQSQAMVDFNFSPCIEFNPEVGDWIRFEYNPNKVFNVTKVEVGTTNLFLTVVPPVPSGSILNHFVLYRCINDGTYVVLDVKKQQPGNSFTGIIQPQYISQTLKNNYNNIIQDLTQKGLIS